MQNLMRILKQLFLQCPYLAVALVCLYLLFPPVNAVTTNICSYPGDCEKITSKDLYSSCDGGYINVYMEIYKIDTINDKKYDYYLLKFDEEISSYSNWDIIGSPYLGFTVEDPTKVYLMYPNGHDYLYNPYDEIVLVSNYYATKYEHKKDSEGYIGVRVKKVGSIGIGVENEDYDSLTDVYINNILTTKREYEYKVDTYRDTYEVYGKDFENVYWNILDFKNDTKIYFDSFAIIQVPKNKGFYLDINYGTSFHTVKYEWFIIPKDIIKSCGGIKSLYIAPN